ncbi:MAG: GNAT family N-acetyltransferase [Deltaproteobacteria bacterium]
MEIREVRATDVPAVIELVAATLAEFGLSFGVGAPTDDQLQHLPASYADHGGAFWVAMDGDQVVGTAGVFPVTADAFELRKMYLLPSTRGTGVGKRLLEASIAWSREHGARLLVLDTVEAMARAIAFYERHGFVRDDTQRRGSRCSRGYALAL